MSGESTIRERLRFNMIGRDTADILREAKPFILAEMPSILDGFYDHIGNFPETAKFFRSREHMMHAKNMQLQHWAIIMDAHFDEKYEASVTKIGEVHNKLGLEPRWYIGGYNALVSGLVNAIAQRMPTGRFERGGPARRRLLAAMREVLDATLEYAKAIECRFRTAGGPQLPARDV